MFERNNSINKYLHRHPQPCEVGEEYKENERLFEEKLHEQLLELEKEYGWSLFGGHEHVCSYRIMNNDKVWQQAQCNEWRKNHPLHYADGTLISEKYDYCDFCPHMNYIKFNSDGFLVYADRNRFTDPIY